MGSDRSTRNDATVARIKLYETKERKRVAKDTDDVIVGILHNNNNKKKIQYTSYISVMKYPPVIACLGFEFGC